MNKSGIITGSTPQNALFKRKSGSPNGSKYGSPSSKANKYRRVSHHVKRQSSKKKLKENSNASRKYLRNVMLDLGVQAGKKKAAGGFYYESRRLGPHVNVPKLSRDYHSGNLR
jgi:hypothetical protein